MVYYKTPETLISDLDAWKLCFLLYRVFFEHHHREVKLEQLRNLECLANNISQHISDKSLYHIFKHFI